jgi:predicted ATPase/class 3 adenylate cyclase
MPVRDRRDDLPGGTVTLLFTDIESSTTVLHALGEAYAAALARHREIVRAAFAGRDGYEVDTQGDGFLVAFARASDAVAAAVEAQRALESEPWTSGVPLRVRMGVHTGEPQLDAEGYVGVDVHRAARICSAAHGGQVVLSRATRDLVGDEPVEGGSLRDLGEHRLKGFEGPERLYQLDAPGLAAEHPPLRTGSAIGLPVPSNRLIGRTGEVKEVRELLGRPEVQLVTLTGPGGTGKSRLALELAWEAVDRFADGVVLVRLAPVADPALVPSTIAAALGVRELGDRPVLAAILDHLRERETLIVVDNVEHLLESVPVLGEIAESSSPSKMLATSRARLGLAGEHVVAVDPLGEDDATALFVERARAADYRFDPDASATAVREICRRLDGLPLAIELAAARVALLPPAALLERLNIALLSGGPADRPERQRTLRATIDWSYGLLTPSQRSLHSSLSVFVGGCTLEAIEAVCDDGEGVLDDLGALISGSLLHRVDAWGEPRYRMHELTRQYALELLEANGRAEDRRRRHAEWVAAFADEAEAGLDGVEQPLWLARLDRELPNIRAAMEWSLTSGRPELALRIGSALGRYWRAHGHVREARGWLEAALASGEVDPPLRARGLWAAARQATAQGDGAAAVPMLEEALTLFRDAGSARDVVFTLSELGFVMRTTGNLERAEQFGTEALAEARRGGDDRALSSALNELMAQASARHDYERARACGSEMLAIRRRIGDSMLVANAANNVGVAALAAGDYQGAEEALEEALGLAVELGDAIHRAAAKAGLGEAALFSGDHERAVGFLAESLQDHIALGDGRGCAECVTALAGVACASGEHSTAARYFGAAAELRAAVGGAQDAVDTRLVERFRSEAVAALGADAFAALEATGRRLSPGDVLDEVRTASLNRTLSPQ